MNKKKYKSLKHRKKNIYILVKIRLNKKYEISILIIINLNLI